jgi:hypothetical protein
MISPQKRWGRRTGRRGVRRVAFGGNGAAAREVTPRVRQQNGRLGLDGFVRLRLGCPAVLRTPSRRVTPTGAVLCGAFMALAVAGCGGATVETVEAPPASSPSTSASVSTQPREAQSVSRSLPVQSSSMSACEAEVRVNSVTTCAFAQNVRKAFLDAKNASGVAPAHVTATSPVTKRSYTLICVLFAERKQVECDAGTASTSFPLSESSPSTQSTQPSSPEAGQGSGGSEGEDRVGSGTHAGDTKFCEAHHCIGRFTEEPGTVAECEDGTFSHAGHIQGACSHHRGVRRD